MFDVRCWCILVHDGEGVMITSFNEYGSGVSTLVFSLSTGGLITRTYVDLSDTDSSTTAIPCSSRRFTCHSSHTYSYAT